MANKRGSKPPFPIHSYPYLIKKMTLEYFDIHRLINYSFLCPHAAQAVSEIRIEVALMEVNMVPVVRGGHGRPEDEQSIKLTFVNPAHGTIQWWFTNGYNWPPEQLHKKVAVNGTLLDKCFQHSPTVIGSLTNPSEMTDHLIAVDNHFRTVFRIQKTNISVKALTIQKYYKYLDTANPKPCQNLHITSWFRHDASARRLFAAFPPKILHYTIDSTLKTELKVDDIFVRTKTKFRAEDLDILNARRMRINNEYRWCFQWTVVDIIKRWMDQPKSLKWDRLEYLRVESESDLSPNWEEVNTAPPRGGYPNKFRLDTEEGPVELDVDNGRDVFRKDGQRATIVREETRKVFWLIVWRP